MIKTILMAMALVFLPIAYGSDLQESQGISARSPALSTHKMLEEFEIPASYINSMKELKEKVEAEIKVTPAPIISIIQNVLACSDFSDKPDPDVFKLWAVLAQITAMQSVFYCNERFKFPNTSDIVFDPKKFHGYLEAGFHLLGQKITGLLGHPLSAETLATLCKVGTALGEYYFSDIKQYHSLYNEAIDPRATKQLWVSGVGVRELVDIFNNFYFEVLKILREECNSSSVISFKKVSQQNNERPLLGTTNAVADFQALSLKAFNKDRLKGDMSSLQPLINQGKGLFLTSLEVIDKLKEASPITILLIKRIDDVSNNLTTLVLGRAYQASYVSFFQPFMILNGKDINKAVRLHSISGFEIFWFIGNHYYLHNKALNHLGGKPKGLSLYSCDSQNAANVTALVNNWIEAITNLPSRENNFNHKVKALLKNPGQLVEQVEQQCDQFYKDFSIDKSQTLTYEKQAELLETLANFYFYITDSDLKEGFNLVTILLNNFMFVYKSIEDLEESRSGSTNPQLWVTLKDTPFAKRTENYDNNSRYPWCCYDIFPPLEQRLYTLSDSVLKLYFLKEIQQECQA